MAKIEQSIEVNAPASAAYQQLCRFEDYPQFMDNVQEITQQGANRLHWRSEKNGKEVEWEAEITDQVQDKVIAWRNTSGAKHIGRVTLQSSTPDKTRITMSMETDEAATGEAGKAAKQKLERDLQRMKECVEAAAGEGGKDEHNGDRQQRQQSSDGMHAEKSNGDRESSHGTNGNGSVSDHGKSVGAQQTGRQDHSAGQYSGQSIFKKENTMSEHSTEQGGSMQFSGEVNQSRSPSQQQGGGTVAQIWAQPARMMSQVSEAFGQMPARMLEQEASMLQRSLGAPQAWLPSMMSAWEEPFVMMRKISEEMEQYLGKVMQRPIGKIGQARISSTIASQQWTPTIEVTQRGNEIIICADLPGLTKADVRLQVQDDKLTIEGERREESNVRSEQGYHRTERSYGHFYRAIPLPDGVDRHRVDAKMRDGVLEISIPLRQQQSSGMRLEIREAEEGELREQRDQRQSRGQQNQQSNQPQNSPQQNQQAGGAIKQHAESGAQEDRPPGKGGSVGFKAEVQS